MFAYILLVVRNSTLGAILMDRFTIHSSSAIFGVYGTVAVFCFVIALLLSCIVEAKIGTSTQVAVKLLHIVAFFVLFVEWTKIALVFHHIFKTKIFDNLIFCFVLRSQFCNDMFVFVSVLFKPL